MSQYHGIAGQSESFSETACLVIHTVVISVRRKVSVIFVGTVVHWFTGAQAGPGVRSHPHTHFYIWRRNTNLEIFTLKHAIPADCARSLRKICGFSLGLPQLLTFTIWTHVIRHFLLENNDEGNFGNNIVCYATLLLRGMKTMLSTKPSDYSPWKVSDWFSDKCKTYNTIDKISLLKILVKDNIVPMSTCSFTMNSDTKYQRNTKLKIFLH